MQSFKIVALILHDFLWLETKTRQQQQQFHEINGFLSLQLGLSFELGFRLRLTNNLVELEASLAPAEAEVGAMAKADQKCVTLSGLALYCLPFQFNKHLVVSVNPYCRVTLLGLF